MLNFKPVLDQDGKPIYDAPNLVRQEPSPLEHTVSYFDDIVVTSKAKPTFEETLKEHFEKNATLVKQRSYFLAGSCHTIL